MSLPLGTRLGPYEVLARVGEGGMGEVYRARDERLGRDVALKVLTPHLLDSPQARERFRREARAVGGLQHPNICTIHDVGETGDGQAYLVMELLQGETLQQRLARGAMNVADIVDISIALTDALAAAHGAGIVHRDIKPANVFLTTRGPKLVDFGLATASMPEEIDPSRATHTTHGLVTEPGTTLGTIAYMSPEQLRGEPLDARTDLFSLGLVLYEMATGRRAFTGATSAAIGGAILHEQPSPPRSIRGDLPDGLNTLIVKAIEKDRALRYQHAADLGADLRRLKRDSDPTLAAAMADARSFLKRHRGWVMAAVGLEIALAIAAGAYVYVRRAPAAPTLTDQDIIVLADFRNTTGDAVFDETLRQGLAVHLGQSPFLKVTTDQQNRRALGLMGKPPTTTITPEIAKDICERTGGSAVLEGSIAPLGTQYVLGLRASACRSGETIAEAQTQADSKEAVLTTLGTMATGFRSRLGESLTTVQEHSTPLIEATTSSLEALKAYTSGHQIEFAEGSASALPLYRRAAELDPQFALAHAQLGLLYSGMGETKRSIESTTRAYQLRDRVSDHERFFITAMYDRQVAGNLERAQQTFELWGRTYPRDSDPVGLLGGLATQGVGEFDRSLETSKEAIRREPDVPYPYFNLAFAHLYLGHIQDAQRELKAVLDRGVDLPDVYVLRYMVAAVTNDRPELDRVTAAAAGKPRTEDWVTHLSALRLAQGGRLREAAATSTRAEAIAARATQRETAAIYHVAPAMWNALYGNAPAARRIADESLRMSSGRDVTYAAGLALALTGESTRSRALADDLDKRFPEDTSVQFTYLPALRAAWAINARQPKEAIAALAPNIPYELGMPGIAYDSFFGALYPVYLRGQALAADGRHAEAAAEFKKVIDHPGQVAVDPIAAFARLRAVQELTAIGEAAKAQEIRTELLNLWSAADAEAAIVANVKK